MILFDKIEAESTLNKPRILVFDEEAIAELVEVLCNPNKLFIEDPKMKELCDVLKADK